MPPADHPATAVHEGCEILGGWVPRRRASRQPKSSPGAPPSSVVEVPAKLEVATTMALVRLIKDLEGQA